MNIRLMRANELREAADLADAVFRDAEQSSMADAFPFIFAPGISHSYGAFTDGGRLVSFMGLVPFTLRMGPARLRVFSMGSVCTDPEFRGRQLASRLLERCKAHAAAAGASLLFVSGDRSLYTRNECYPFGHVKRYTLDPAAADSIIRQTETENAFTVRPFESADLFAAVDIAAARLAAFEHSVSDWPLLQEASAYASCLKLEQRTLLACDADGQSAGWVTVAVPGARPSKHSPRLIDSAGSAEAVCRLAAEAVARYGLERLEWHVPWHEERLHARLAEAGAQGVAEPNGGTVHIVSVRRLAEQAGPYWSSVSAYRLRPLEDGGALVRDPDGRETRLAAEELAAALLSPASGSAPDSAPGPASDSASTAAVSAGAAAPGPSPAPEAAPRPGSESLRLALPPLPLPYVYGLNFI